MEDLERIKGKIAKLLALAESGCNEHEAANAAAKARAYMDKYQIEAADLGDSSPTEQIEEVAHGFSTARWPTWKQTLAVRVATVNDCFVVFQRNGGGRVLVFQGFSSDVNLCLQMYDYLVGTVNQMAEVYRTARNAFMAEVNCYREGLGSTISKRLQDIADNRKRECITGTGTALVVVKLGQVAEVFGQDRYKKAQGRSFTQADSMKRAAFVKGKVDGHTVTINEEIS